MEDTALRILVVVLSIFLAIFLLLSIYVLARLIQVLNHIKGITRHAEKMAGRADNVSEFFAKSAAPVAIAKLLANLTEVMKSRSKRKGNKSNNKEE